MTKIEEAAQKYVDQRTWDDVCEKNNVLASFMDGAEWQKEQFEKNRLAACESQTKEEAEREQDFVMSIIDNEHRKPTFSDAIEYGMRVQKEQMIDKACEWLKIRLDSGCWVNQNLSEEAKDALIQSLHKIMEAEK